MTVTIPTNKPKAKLTGRDGNAFAILGFLGSVARRNGWTREEIDAFNEEATSGDYNHLLATAMKHFDVS